MITEHKASHDHENLDQTVSCLIETAIFAMNVQDEYADNSDLVKFHIAQNDKLNAEIAVLKNEISSLRLREKNTISTMMENQRFLERHDNRDYSENMVLKTPRKA